MISERLGVYRLSNRLTRNSRTKEQHYFVNDLKLSSPYISLGH